jgi:quinol monooxygenase YgiN
MIIIAGHHLVSAPDRDPFVDAFRGLVMRAREFDGCISIAITADSVDPERINTLEIWRDADALNAWRKKARGPRTGKPKFSDVRRYDASDGGSLF